MSQINSKKSTSFQSPPTDMLGWGFDEFGNPCKINSDGSKTILETGESNPASVNANKGIGLEADLPVSFVQGDVFVTTDSLLIYTALDSTQWETNALQDSQFVTDSSTGLALYQYINGVLIAVYDDRYKGFYADEAALNSAFPTGEDGWYATVGTTDTTWFWDDDTTAWLDSSIPYSGMAVEIKAASLKSTPVDADEFGYVDTEVGDTLKKFTWTNIKATLKTYFDTLYNNYVLTKAKVEDVLTGTITSHTHSGIGTDSDAIHNNVSGEINGVADKSIPIDADVFLGEDSASSYVKKKFTWANIKATLKTYFDGLYSTVTNFLGLSDTPSDYSGQSGKIVAVKSTEDGLEFIVAGGGGGSGHTIKENGNAMTDRANLDFIDFTTEDNVGEDASKITHAFGNEANVDNTNQVEGSAKVWDVANAYYTDQEQEEFDLILNLNESNILADAQMAIYIPAGYKIKSIFVNETSSNAAGNISIGTAASGTQIVNAYTVGSDADEEMTLVADYFSRTADQDIYVSSSVWGSGVIDIIIRCVKIW